MSDKDPKDPREEEAAAPEEAQEDQAQVEASEDDGDDTGDTYDIRDELDDHTRHVLDQLTDEERAALEEGDEPESDEAEEAEPGPEPEPAAEPEPEPEPEAAEATQPPAQEPAVTVALTEDDMKAIKTAKTTARDEALKKWNDGDLTDDELRAALDQADEDADEQREAILAKKREEAEAAEFAKLQASFVEAAKGYAQEHPGLVPIWQDFDQYVQAVSMDPRFDIRDFDTILKVAHSRFLADAQFLKLDVPPLEAKQPEPAPKPADKPKKAKREVVPTLAKVPAAASNATSEGKWGGLQARFDACRNVDEQEKLLLSLNAEEREAFASMDV